MDAPARRASRRSTRLLIAAVCALVLLVVPSIASAENYSAGLSFTCSGGHGMGGVDQAGTAYIPCPGQGGIVKITAAGAKSLVPSTVGRTSIAPSPDGKYIYLANGLLDRLTFNAATGRYEADAWAPAKFTYGGKQWTPDGFGVTTDGYGNIYLANGGWAAGQPNMVVKYAPDGSVVTGFGDSAILDKPALIGPCQNASILGPDMELGKFFTAMGIGVTRDGSSVFVSENSDCRVQRFDRTGPFANSGYTFARVIAGLTPTGAAPLTFSASYDVQVDAYGNVYSSDTSSHRMWKFDRDGAFLAAVGTVDSVVHGIAVTSSGTVCTGEHGRCFNRAAGSPALGAIPALPPAPKTDFTAPVLTSVSVPAETASQTIPVTIQATDDTGVTEVRFADEQGNPGPWLPYTQTMQVRLTDGYSVKGLTVVVRDGVGRESASRYVTLNYRPEPDAIAPTVQLSGPTWTPTQAVTVNISAADNVAVTQMRVADEHGDFGAWQPVQSTLTTNLTSGDGLKAVQVQVTDAAGNVSQLAVLRILLSATQPDATAPTVLVSGPASAPAGIVHLALQGNDDVGVTQYRIADASGDFSAWRTYAQRVDVTLSGAAGTKLFFIQVRDAAYRISDTQRIGILMTAPGENTARAGAATGATQSVTVRDHVAPTVVRVTAAAKTCKRNLVITLRARDDARVTSMRFANENGKFGAWTRYATRHTQKLSPKAGAKRVTVQVRDAAGNVSRSKTLRTRVSC